MPTESSVDYHAGREGTDVYGEKWNGIQTGVLHHRHHFGVLKEKISPYVVPGDRGSGVLPRISNEAPGEYGRGDKRIQAGQTEAITEPAGPEEERPAGGDVIDLMALLKRSVENKAQARRPSSKAKPSRPAKPAGRKSA